LEVGGAGYIAIKLGVLEKVRNFFDIQKLWSFYRRISAWGRGFSDLYFKKNASSAIN
jgi:hypothetical protein